MSTARVRCWSCGTEFFKTDRYCSNCEKDSWNPPQGPAARNAAYSPVMGTPQTVADSNSPVYTQTASSNLAGGYGQKIAAGVSILATLAALGFWFWFAIGLIAGITNGDVMGGRRVFVAFLASIVLTTLTWWIALMIVED